MLNDLILHNLQGLGGGKYRVGDIISGQNILPTYWLEDINEQCFAIAVDLDLNIYVATRRVVKKLNNEGELLWEFADIAQGANDWIRDIDVDNNGNIYVAVSSSDNHSLFKIDTNGNKVWSIGTPSRQSYALVLDKNNSFVYLADGSVVRKYDVNGNEFWEYTGHSATIRGLGVDSNGYVYSGDSDRRVHKIDPNGFNVWTRSLAYLNEVRDLAIDNSDYVYVGLSTGGVWKLDPDSGSTIWEYTAPTNLIETLAIDENNNIFAGSRDGNIYKINSDGNELWRLGFHTGFSYSLFVDKYGFIASCGSDGLVFKIDNHTGMVSIRHVEIIG